MLRKGKVGGHYRVADVVLRWKSSHTERCRLAIHVTTDTNILVLSLSVLFPLRVSAVPRGGIASSGKRKLAGVGTVSYALSSG